MSHRLWQSQQAVGIPEEQRVTVPQVEKLTVNYRTHNGILNCAAEIVDVLLSLFPNAVDRLARDRGHFNGPKPQLLTETGTDNLAILLVGSDRIHSQIEFGAHQAVLVRSQASKDSLPDEFDGALVLTIFEAKGLEFDDVFIYNFFADSPADEKTWRVLTSWWDTARRPNMSAAERMGLTIPAPRPVKFDRTKHGILEEELKQLYTAITRARVRVAIYDASEEKRQPFFSYLHTEGFADIADERGGGSGGGSARTGRGWAVAAGREEWQSRARNLFENKLFKLAARCYSKANDRLGMLNALAYQLFEESTKLPAGRPQQERLIRAALAFDAAGELKKAASCLAGAAEYSLAAVAREKLGQVEMAAKVLARGAEEVRKEGGHTKATALLTEAAMVYERAGQLHAAVSVRVSHRALHAQLLSSLDALGVEHPEQRELMRFAFQHLEHKKNWDACLQLAKRLQGCDVGDVAIDALKVDKIAQRAAFAHQRNGECKLMVEAVRLFSRDADKIRFLDQTHEMEEAAALLVELGRHPEAVNRLLVAVSTSKDDLDGSNRRDLLARAAKLAHSSADSLGKSISMICSTQLPCSAFCKVVPYTYSKQVIAQEPCKAASCKACLEQMYTTFASVASRIDTAGADEMLIALFALLPSAAIEFPTSLCPFRIAVSMCERLEGQRRRGADLLWRQCENFLRVVEQQPPLRSMPTWIWLCDAAGHDPTAVCRVRSDEFSRILAGALLQIRVAWLNRAPKHFFTIRSEMQRRVWSSCADARSSSIYVSKLCDEFQLAAGAASMRLELVHPSHTWLRECVERCLHLLYSDFREVQGDVPSDTTTVLPYGCHYIAKEELRAALSKAARDVTEVLHRWYAALTDRQRVCDLRVGAVLHFAFVDLASEGVNISKALDDKAVSLEKAAAIVRSRGMNIPSGKHRRMLPARILLIALFCEKRGKFRDLAESLRKYIDYIELTAEYAGMHDQRSAHATPLGREGLFAPALGTCAFLVGRLQGKLAKSCACRSHWSAVVC